MKKLLLLITMLMVSYVEAKIENPYNDRGNYFMEPQTITFEERGISFFVFPDGEFDFNTEPIAETSYLHRRGNTTVVDNGVVIQRDFEGKVRRIGNVFINYNHRDQIARVGSVSINYHRGRLTKVGNMRIQYHRNGLVRYIGSVKRIRPVAYTTNGYGGNYSGYYYGPSHQNIDAYSSPYANCATYSYNDPFFYSGSFSNHYDSFDEDDTYFYYRSKGAKRGQKKGSQTVIKRKKKATRTSRR